MNNVWIIPEVNAQPADNGTKQNARNTERIGQYDGYRQINNSRNERAVLSYLKQSGNFPVSGRCVLNPSSVVIGNDNKNSPIGE